MPIHERDPWRLQFFNDIRCPADVHIPTDDPDAYCWNPEHRWVYNKLLIAESQGLACAPHGVSPAHYPVFSKPIYNLDGMGVGSRVLRNQPDYAAHETAGHMWMTLMEGDHLSTDIAVIDGIVRWTRHTAGLALFDGTFDYWTVEARRRPALETFLTGWIAMHLRGYTGMVNLETIGGRIIEAHLRFADQWPDLYGRGWLDAVVRLYADGVWEYAESDRRDGYSVVLFGPHEQRYRHPSTRTAAAILSRSGVSSLQFTFHENRPGWAHAMPPGGFRVAIINTWDLAAGLDARRELARNFDLLVDETAGGEVYRFA